MDFVSYLIQEGYSEEEVSVILETAYIIEQHGGGNIMEEVEYITEVRALLLRQLAKLKSLPQTPAIRKQIQRLQKMLGGKADDAAQVATKADDAVKTTKQTSGRITGDVVDDAAKAGTKADDAAKVATKADDAVKKPPGKWSRRGKATAALMTGAAGYGLLTGDGKNGSGNNGDDGPGGPGGPDGPGGPGGPGSDTPGGDNKTGSGDNKTGSGSNSGKPKGKFWWDTMKPKSLGYQMQPSVSSYRNIRSHHELRGKVINESHAVVLNYLITEGHANDIDEANYVMMQLDFDHIQEIISENTY